MVAEFFPYLRDRVAHLGYIGTGHTLDLQNKLPYDTVYDYGASDLENRKAKFMAIAQDYDVFITASDYEAAVWAKSLGLTLIIYDPLTWYWPKIPAVVTQADFYVAQNFFGVSERLTAEATQFPPNVVVPPIISGLNYHEVNSKELALLVNLGGLSNPYLQDKEFIAFAKVVLRSVKETLEPEFEHTYYVSSFAIANGAKEVCSVQSLLPHQVQRILNTAKLAIMTSGLGNIFEAATMQKRVLWLPPANDSQGQQMKLLQKHQMSDFAIDWHEIIDDEGPINYFAPQTEVLARIATCMQKLATCKKAQSKLKALLLQALNEANVKQERLPALSKLTDTFEVGGAKLACETIIQYLSTL